LASGSPRDGRLSQPSARLLLPAPEPSLSPRLAFGLQPRTINSIPRLAFGCTSNYHSLKMSGVFDVSVRAAGLTSVSASVDTVIPRSRNREPEAIGVYTADDAGHGTPTSSGCPLGCARSSNFVPCPQRTLLHLRKRLASRGRQATGSRTSRAYGSPVRRDSLDRPPVPLPPTEPRATSTVVTGTLVPRGDLGVRAPARAGSCRTRPRAGSGERARAPRPGAPFPLRRSTPCCPWNLRIGSRTRLSVPGR